MVFVEYDRNPDFIPYDFLTYIVPYLESYGNLMSF